MRMPLVDLVERLAGLVTELHAQNLARRAVAGEKSPALIEREHAGGEL